MEEVQVFEDVGDFEVNCPLVAEPYEEFECAVIVYSGTGTTMEFDFDNGTVETFTIPGIRETLFLKL